MMKQLVLGMILFLSVAGQHVFAQTPTPAPLDEVKLVSTAPTFRAGERVRVGPDETIPGDLYIAGDSVTIEGTVMGDVYAAGGVVQIAGTVEGDVLAGGGQLDIRGQVQGHVRAAGGTIQASGTVDKNMSLAGGTVDIAPEAKLAGSLGVAGGVVRLDAPLAGHVVAAGGSVVLLKPIQGSLSYFIGDEQSGDVDEDLVAGEVRRFETPRMGPSSPISQEQQKTFFSFFVIIRILSLLIVGLLLLYAAPHFMRSASKVVRTQVWKSLGVGSMVMLGVPVLAIMLVVTLVGFPVGMMLAAVYVMVLYLGSFVTMFAIGQLIKKQFDRSWTDATVFAVGLCVVLVAELVPVTGLIVQLVGIGGLILSGRMLIQQVRESKML